LYSLLLFYLRQGGAVAFVRVREPGLTLDRPKRRDGDVRPAQAIEV